MRPNPNDLNPIDRFPLWPKSVFVTFVDDSTGDIGDTGDDRDLCALFDPAHAMVVRSRRGGVAFGWKVVCKKDDSHLVGHVTH